jgi:hypothetical protein
MIARSTNVFVGFSLVGLGACCGVIGDEIHEYDLET